MWKPLLGTSLAVVTGVGSTLALGTEQDEKRGDHRPPAPRWVQVLDSNHDGKLGADEIAKASDRLKELDDNGDGELVAVELMPDGGRGQHVQARTENRRGGHPGPPRHEMQGRPHDDRDTDREMGPPHRGFGPPWQRPEFGRPGFGRPDFGGERHGESRGAGVPGGPGQRRDAMERGFSGAPGRPFMGPPPFLAQRRGERPMPPRFEDLDKDGDGAVSREEFMDAKPPHIRGAGDIGPGEPEARSERRPHMELPPRAGQRSRRAGARGDGAQREEVLGEESSVRSTEEDQATAVNAELEEAEVVDTEIAEG